MSLFPLDPSLVQELQTLTIRNYLGASACTVSLYIVEVDDCNEVWLYPLKVMVIWLPAWDVRGSPNIFSTPQISGSRYCISTVSVCMVVGVVFIFLRQNRCLLLSETVGALGIISELMSSKDHMVTNRHQSRPYRQLQLQNIFTCRRMYCRVVHTLQYLDFPCTGTSGIQRLLFHQMGLPCSLVWHSIFFRDTIHIQTHVNPTWRWPLFH